MLDSITTILSALFGLAAVLLLAYFLLKWMGKRMPASSGTRQIRVLDRLSLAPDKALLVVRVAEKTLLIGMGPHTVETLCELEDPQGVLEEPEASPQSFSSLLKKSIGRTGADGKGGKL